MIHAASLKESLCGHFCAGFSVNPTPTGYAIGTTFLDDSGDAISFHLIESDDGLRIEDDGDYLSSLVARDIAIDQGMRGSLLDDILAEADAYWDRDTYEIRTEPFPEKELLDRSARFISSLIRVRDLALLTREIIRSTFREDAAQAITNQYSKIAAIEENGVIDARMAEYPVDLIIRPSAKDKLARIGAVHFVTTSDSLNEALLHKMEVDATGRDDVCVIALLEKIEGTPVSAKRIQRAMNRSLPMAGFRGDEEAAVAMIGRTLSLSH